MEFKQSNQITPKNHPSLSQPSSIQSNSSTTPYNKKLPLIKFKGMKFLMFYCYLSTILIIVLLIGLGLMYKQMQNINHYLAQAEKLNLSSQIKTDCQLTALVPQNCH